MVGIIVAVVFFFVLWVWSESFIVAAAVTLMAMAYFGVSFNDVENFVDAETKTEIVQQLGDAETLLREQRERIDSTWTEDAIGLMEQEPKEFPYTGSVTSDHFADLPDGRITDKIRNEEVVDLSINANGSYQACRNEDDCYKPDILKHDGVVFACQPDTVHCYRVQ